MGQSQVNEWIDVKLEGLPMEGLLREIDLKGFSIIQLMLGIVTHANYLFLGFAANDTSVHLCSLIKFK